MFPVTNRYRNLGEIGRGAMGTVFRAIDEQLGEEVALKVLQNSSVDATRELKREFRSTADVVHPNLVRLYELDATAASPYFTMELVEGEDLLSWAGSNPGSLALQPLLDGLRQLLDGLAAIHTAGLLHRDLKPSNVLVTPEGRLVILDFGLAAPVEPLGAFRDPFRYFAGTLDYAAPEVLFGWKPSPASDLYAVGVMLYEALGGSIPAVDDLRKLAEIKRTRAYPVIEPGAAVPEQLVELAWDLMRPEHEERVPLEHAAAVVTELLGDTTPTASSVMTEVPLTGRQRELDLLAEAFRRTHTDGSVVVDVHGESGVGKSRLVAEYLRSLGEDAMVLAGRCHPNEHVAYRALDRLMSDLYEVIDSNRATVTVGQLSKLDPALFRLFPVLEVPGEDDQRISETTLEKIAKPQLLQRAIAALRSLLAAITEGGTPVVIFIDDAQWTGEDSAVLLRDLLAQPNDLPILTVLCSRDDTATKMPTALASIVDTRIEVAAMSEADARALVQALPLDPSEAESILSEAAGNPYLIVELAREVADKSAQGVKTGFHRGKFDEILDARMGRLKGAAHMLLERMAVAGRPVHAAEVAPKGASTFGAIRRLEDARFIRADLIDGERLYLLVHDRVRAHVLASLDAATIGRHHEAIARALLDQPDPPPELVVFHLREAGDRDMAYPYAVRAAKVATTTLAFSRAVALCREAYELAPERERNMRRLELAEALARAGFGDEAAKHFLALAAVADDADATQLEQRAAEQLLFSGHQRQGIDVLAAVLSRVGETMPRSRTWAAAKLVAHNVTSRTGPMKLSLRNATSHTPAQLHRVDALHTAALGLSMSEAILSAAIGIRHLNAARDAGEPLRLSRVLSIQLAQSSAHRYDPEQTRILRDQAMDLAKQAGSAEPVALVRLAAATAAWMEGRFEDCFVEASAIGSTLDEEAPGLQFYRDCVSIIRLAAVLHTGRWRDLAALAPEALADASRRGDLYLGVNVKVRYGAFRWIARDAPAQGIEEVASGSEAWPRDDFDLIDLFAVQGRATCLLYDEQPQAALDVLEAALPAMSKSYLLNVGFLRTLIYHLRGRALIAAAMTAGSTPDERRVRQWTAKLRKIGSPFSRVCATSLDAELSYLAGNTHLAIEGLEDSVRGFEATGMRLDAAAAHTRLATLRGDDDAANDALQRLRLAGVRRPMKWARLIFPSLSQA